MRVFVRILKRRYGIGFYDANPIVTMWVIDLIHKQSGVDYAKKILREVNDKRDSMGMLHVYVTYGPLAS